MKKKLDWVKINNEYKGLWVALDEEETRVVSWSKEAKSSFEEAVKKGINAPILFRVPDEALSYVGMA